MEMQMKMKKVEAIVRPEKFDVVKKALEERGIVSLTAYDVRGRGEQKGVTLQYRGKAVNVDLLPKIKIEIVVGEDRVKECVAAIIRSGKTGNPGDGKIFIMDVERCITVRSFEECNGNGPHPNATALGAGDEGILNTGKTT
jgi:nitrogen regulatory protein P-II 1